MKRRYPTQALMDATGVTVSVLTRQHGVSSATVRNGFTEYVAERVAVELGWHPANIWPDWLDEAKVPCGNDRCDQRFVPTRKNHRFCSRACKSVVAMRRKYAADPEYRQRRQAQARAYYDECGEAVRAAERRRYWSDPERFRQDRRERYAAQQQGQVAS